MPPDAEDLGAESTGGPKPAALDGPGVTVTDPDQLLAGYLEWYREALIRKIIGLPEEVLRTPVDPLGWSPLGLVRHLGWVERRWIQWGFAAQQVTPYPPAGSEWQIADYETAQAVLAAYTGQVVRSRSLTAGLPLSTPARVGGRFAAAEEAPSLGRILFHLFQEYARHLGHLDIARELIDGVTGE